MSGGLGGGAALGAPEARAAMGAAVRRRSAAGAVEEGGEVGGARAVY